MQKKKERTKFCPRLVEALEITQDTQDESDDYSDGHALSKWHD